MKIERKANVLWLFTCTREHNSWNNTFFFPSAGSIPPEIVLQAVFTKPKRRAEIEICQLDQIFSSILLRQRGERRSGVKTNEGGGRRVTFGSSWREYTKSGGWWGGAVEDCEDECNSGILKHVIWWVCSISNMLGTVPQCIRMWPVNQKTESSGDIDVASIQLINTVVRRMHLCCLCVRGLLSCKFVCPV